MLNVPIHLFIHTESFIGFLLFLASLQVLINQCYTKPALKVLIICSESVFFKESMEVPNNSSHLSYYSSSMIKFTF